MQITILLFLDNVKQARLVEACDAATIYHIQHIHVQLWVLNVQPEFLINLDRKHLTPSLELTSIHFCACGQS